MSMQLTTDQVLALAPDASSASAGKKLGKPGPWTETGQSAATLWGRCQGSDLYNVCIDLSSLTITCTCPSRKHPCKHGLGLLLLACTTPATIPTCEPPEWAANWLAKRETAHKARETREAHKTSATPEQPSASQTKRKEKRIALMMRGIEQLDLWLDDLIRTGLAQVATQPATFWESQAARMVDAQMPGIATRLHRIAALPNASSDWPAKLLAQLGQLTLLTHAFRRIEQLAPLQQDDLRQLLGWNIDQDEVLARGEQLTDDWLIVGQYVEDGTRLRTQYTWLLGNATGRSALVLQFALPNQGFQELLPVGTCQRATLSYWPGAVPQRALIADRSGTANSIEGQLSTFTTVEAFLDQTAHLLSRQPWLERFLCPLHTVTPIPADAQWYVSDSKGDALPLAPGPYWRLLALSGGAPLDIVGEWNGDYLTLLGAIVNNRYYAMGAGL